MTMILFNAATSFGEKFIQSCLSVWIGASLGFIIAVWSKTNLIETEIIRLRRMLQTYIEDASKDGKERRLHE